MKKQIKSGRYYKEIAEEFHVNISFISKINKGIYFKDEDENYPLYDKTVVDQKIIDNIIYELKYCKTLSMSNIAQNNNISYSMIKKINQGKLRRKQNEQYPLR